MNDNNLDAQNSDTIHFAIGSNPRVSADAAAIRTIVYVEEQGMERNLAFDGNDELCTHVVVYKGEEPVGAIRVRFFCQFAKLERMAIRKEHRSTRLLKQFLDFVLSHIARKGYPVVMTHAAPEYARLWCKLYGFYIVENKLPVYFNGHDTPYLELRRDLAVPDNAITLNTDVATLYRIEGQWDKTGEFENSHA